jgi:putative flippase GtrA
VVDASSLRTVGARSMCTECEARVRRDIRLWPFGYIVGIGVVLHPTAALVLLGIAYHRLGRLTRGSWLFAGAALLGVLTAVAVAIHALTQATAPSLPFGASTALAAAITLSAAYPYRDEWSTHRDAGGSRASLLFPILGTLAAIIGVALTIAVIALVIGVPIV